MRRFLGSGSLFCVLAAASIGHAKDERTEAPAAPVDELYERLARVPGLTLVDEGISPAPGFRFVVLSFTQPIDHHRPAEGTFQQTLTLLHHSFDAPMVKFTTGYDLPLEAFRDEVTALVDGNQINIEERFFASSRPEPADYGDVSIYQAAADHHRVVEAFRALYAGNWLSTGTSKGGMATIYHRRFFADDLDGSVAYVAPNDVDNADDRYDEFFETVGSDPACRDRLHDVQRRALLMREEIAPWMAELVATTGCTLEATSSADEAFELMVTSTEWAFWQTETEANCAFIPGPGAFAYEVLNYVGSLGLLWACDFARAGQDFTYEYQAGTELGWPDRDYPHLADLLRYPDIDQPRTYVPASISMDFDPLVMSDIDAWVRSAGSELLFIYGETDPWGAEPFELGEGSVDSYSYVAPGQNHSRAGVATLSDADQVEAANTIRRWAGLPPLGAAPLVAASSSQRPVLEALFGSELDERRGTLRQGRRL